MSDLSKDVSSTDKPPVVLAAVSILGILSVIGVSYMAGSSVDLVWAYEVPSVHEFTPSVSYDNILFNSHIVEIDPDLFRSYNLHRYVVHGGIVVLPDPLPARLHATGNLIMRDIPITFDSAPAAQIDIDTGFDVARNMYNATGDGVVVAVVDSGVDFSNPDLMHAVARDEFNRPIMLDPDGAGLVLTNATFYASVSDGRIYNTDAHPNHTSNVYVNKDGVFLNGFQGGKGTMISVYNSFFPRVGSEPVFDAIIDDDYKIGNSATDFIVSQSGVYHLGVALLADAGNPIRIQLVPILVVDSTTPGIYDTIIPDMSSSWGDFYSYELPDGVSPVLDFDFTDETPILLGNGNEMFIYDSDKDGTADYSAGMAGAHVLDVYGVISNTTLPEGYVAGAINATLLEPLDPSGDYLGVMFDIFGHGTAVSSMIASQGERTYDIYNNSGSYTISGVAPDARILPISGLWVGNIEYGWLWAAGMDNDGDGWHYTGKPRADIITNSWGIPIFRIADQAHGFDWVSGLANVLATPSSIHSAYPGTVMITSSGNYGHGYGTAPSPASAPYLISVGATSNSGYVNIPSLQGVARFGNDTAHFGHLVDFSSRGPNIWGESRPDVMAMGAYGFALKSVTRDVSILPEDPYTTFGGTSASAPLVAGSSALVIELLRENNMQYDPFVIKNILMSTADDTGNDAFVQGAGRLDAGAAASLASGDAGLMIYNDASYLNTRNILSQAPLNTTFLGLSDVKLPGKPYPMTSWYAGHLDVGERSSTTYTLYNPTDKPIRVQIDAVQTAMVQESSLSSTTIPFQQDPVMNATDVYAPNYIPLSDVRTTDTLREFFAPNPIPDSTMLAVNVEFGFDQFVNGTAEAFGDDFSIASLYIYDWIDADMDNDITAGELAMVGRAGAWGTGQEQRISYPQEVFDGTPVVGIYPVPLRFSYWTGEVVANATGLDYTVHARYYDRVSWPAVWLDSNAVTVPPDSSVDVGATVTIPSAYGNGAHQGFLRFSYDDHDILAPISFAVTGSEGVSKTDGIIHSPGHVRGAFDWASYYVAGDWNLRYVQMPEEAKSGVVEVSWLHNNTNVGIFVVDPTGEVIASNMDPGVFGTFAGWPSSDWLGSQGFGGGAFYPVKHWNQTGAILHFPSEESGLYTIILHATTYDGKASSEDIQVSIQQVLE